MVALTRDGYTVTLTISSNEFNTVTVPLCTAISAEIEKIRNDNSIKVVIVTAQGNFFSNGFEPTHFINQSEVEVRALLAAAFHLSYAFYSLPQITIAALNGHAMGVGAIWAIFMNYRIAVEKMRFGFPEAQIGLAIPAAPAFLLQRMLGSVKARDLAFLGLGLKSAHALALGLLDEIVPQQSDLLKATKKIVDRFKNIPYEVCEANQLSTKATDFSLIKELIAKDIDLGVRMVLSPKGQEGLKSILEKRRPIFS